MWKNFLIPKKNTSGNEDINTGLTTHSSESETEFIGTSDEFDSDSEQQCSNTSPINLKSDAHSVQSWEIMRPTFLNDIRGRNNFKTLSGRNRRQHKNF